MAAWVVALLVGALLAALQYLRGDRRASGSALPAALLRALAATLVGALALDAPAGRARRPAPLVALDASASWLRGGDGGAWRAARDSAAAARRDSVFLFGDSLRPDDGATGQPADHSSRVAPAVDRALGVGRPLVVITDGELVDSEALGALPAGSRVVVVPRRPAVDVAVAGVEAPRAVVDGDTIEVRVTLSAGAAGAPGGTLVLTVDGRALARTTTTPLAAYAERPIVVRSRLTAARVGPALLQASVATPRDAEPRNDTLSVGVQVARGAGAVFVSTAPDFDARFALTVLRGALAIPTRGYYRVAPNEWRTDGPLARVAESDVRAAIREAPLVVLHGDTALFGAPRGITEAALALVAAPIADDGEWYATGAPPSPLSGALAGLPWDSLPPVDASDVEPRGDWAGLETRRGRSGERRTVIAGWERSRRVIVVSAAGLWRWRFRGGASADAYAAVWGGVFDWLAAGRGDVRGIVPEASVLREGDPVRWRRGSSADSVVRVALTPRASAARAETVTVRFGAGAAVAETPGLRRGVYDLAVPGGRVVLAVNASAEWLPRAPRASARVVSGAPASANAPTLRNARWAYALAIALLCVEWILRRRQGMR
ncbi:MAG: hypothetical protein ABR499_18155 [Gemmatimonadaceae bacterium]